MQLRPKAATPDQGSAAASGPTGSARDGTRLQATTNFSASAPAVQRPPTLAERPGPDTGRDRERRLPPLGGDTPSPRPELLGQRALAEELDGLARTIHEVDPRAAERLSDLGHSLATEAGRSRWADVDLRRAFNTDRIAHAWAVRREGGYSSGSIDLAARIRDVLVLVPLLLTWFAFYEASKAYDAFLTANPEQAGSPFLLLWQRGFGGEGGIFATSFSTVALIDAILIALIIFLTFYSQGRRDHRDDKIALRAARFQTDLDNVLSSAAVALAADRAGRPALLAQSVERLAERFERSSASLLSQLQVEHNRLEQVAALREREFADFGVFASGMRAGAEETHRLLIDLRQLSTSLQNTLEDLTSEVSVAGDQQRTLLGAVGNLDRLIGAGIQSDQAVTRQLGEAAGNLAEAADRALAGSETAAQAGRIASEAVRGIAELTSTLAASQARVESAVATEAEANAHLADALRGSTGGVAASTKLLNEIGGGLAQLHDEFARLADQSVAQTDALRKMLGEQNNIADNLAEVARDLSAVGITTAQRQREVNEDLSGLMARLDGLTNVLARASGGAPSTESLQQAFAAALRAELHGNGAALPPPRTAAPSSPPDALSAERTSLWPRPQRRPGE